jgi:hypothetical protein
VASAVGALRLMYIPEALIVRGDPAATATNLAAHETLFRLGIVSNLVGSILFVFVTLALYRLLERVDRSLAVLMVIFGSILGTPVFFLNTVNDVGALLFARGDAFLSIFEKAQREAFTMLFLRLYHQAILANEFFWGLWLLPFGLLVYRSRFLPRFLGVWLMVACAGWLALALTGLLLPVYEEQVFKFIQPVVLGEVATMLWLVIRGAREPGLAVQGSVAS